MKGLELSEKYYREYGEPMLREKFPELLPRIAAGLFGAGSEVLGFDDEASQDHDFEPGFCIFLPGEDAVSRREAFLLERAYNALPKEFMGIRRSLFTPAGGRRHGVIRLFDFLEARIGKEAADRAVQHIRSFSKDDDGKAPDADSSSGILSIAEWLSLPEQYLLEASGGRIFLDESGFLAEIREELRFFPEDIAQKKLAGNLLYAAQTGQYNYERCLVHKENLAAQTALAYFTEAALHCFFLLSGRYMPYYKWRFRAFTELAPYSGFLPDFEFLLTRGNDPKEADTKKEIIAKLLKAIVRDAGLPEEKDPGDAAYLLNDRIRDSDIRNLHILCAVHEG